MRTCPRCNIPLLIRHMKNEEIDLCSRCGGSFFDDGELERTIELFQILEQVSINEPEIESYSSPQDHPPLLCPADKTPMLFEEQASIIIDRCPQCDGIWLDNGELVALRLAQSSIRSNLQLYIRLGE